MGKRFYTVDEARSAARRRMPRLIFDFIDGGAVDEVTLSLNSLAIQQIKLQPRVLIDVEERSLNKRLLGRDWGLPFGIAPMGMCNLTWPHTDRMLAAAALRHSVPIGFATMASTSIEDARELAGDNAWFQLYVSQSEDIASEMIGRAERAGYDTLVFTVDVPVNSPRPREQRLGFQAPLKLGMRQIIDFALHPKWSISTLIAGVPQVANNVTATSGQFVRSESRGRVDWNFLARLRERWKGHLIVKGVLVAEDASRVQASGCDAVYVSNHGGRQLDSAPATIQALPAIRAAVGNTFPVLIDSGVRDGEGVLKALALGADFVMLGRPFLYGIGGGGEQGLESIFELLRNQLDTALAQTGKTDVQNVDLSILFGVNNFSDKTGAD